MFSAQYRRIIKDRTQCDVYYTSELGTAQCAPINDTAKDSIPGKKQTKVARLVDLIRYTRGGKITNGYDPQMDPYNNPPPPIIDGLRHGAVPASMRKNKF
jgi:hypothetical protein